MSRFYDFSLHGNIYLPARALLFYAVHTFRIFVETCKGLSVDKKTVSRDLQNCRLSFVQRNFHGNCQLVRLMQVLGPDLGQQAFIASGIVWSVKCDHFPSVFPFVIAGLNLTADIKTFQLVQIFFADLICFWSFLIIEIDIFAIERRDTGGIFCFLHAAFYLKGIYSGLDQLRQIGNGAHILQTQRKCCIRRYRLASTVTDLIRQSAWLGTSSSISASTAQYTAEKALA